MEGWEQMTGLDERIREVSIEGKTVADMMEKSKGSPDAFFRLNQELEKRLIRVRFLKSIRDELDGDFVLSPIRLFNREVQKLFVDLKTASAEYDPERWITEKAEIEIKLEECFLMVDRLAS